MNDDRPAATRRRAGGAVTHQGRILWVDDEVDMLRPHTRLLTSSGYDVDTVMNGNDALELLEAESYDLVLLDEQMPGLRGIEVLERMRRRGRRVPVVMVTKSEADSTMHEAIGREVDDYIVKPTSPRQVLSVVTRLLAGAKLRHERIAREFTSGFGELRHRVTMAESWRDWTDLFSRMVDWELGLDSAGETDLLEVLDTLRRDVRREFCDMVCARYSGWVNENADERPAAQRRRAAGVLRAPPLGRRAGDARGDRLPAARPVARDRPVAGRATSRSTRPCTRRFSRRPRRSRATRSSAGCFPTSSRPGDRAGTSPARTRGTTRSRASSCRTTCASSRAATSRRTTRRSSRTTRARRCCSGCRATCPRPPSRRWCSASSTC